MKKIIALILACALCLGCFAACGGGKKPLTNDDTGSVSPSAVTNAIKEYTLAVEKLIKDMEDEELLETALTRFGGLTSFASGCFAVLQMTGIIKDPTAVKLALILEGIGDIKEELRQMDAKLDNIAQQLYEMSADAEEKARQTKARDLLSYWRTFKSTYQDPLELKLDEYKGMINEALSKWWKEGSHEGVRVIYAELADGPALSFSAKNYSDGLPETADNGEIIAADSSFGIPADCMPKTDSKSFNINTYETDFTEMAADAILKAANDKKLDASGAFYEKWNGLSNDGRVKAAEGYAEDLLSTVLYHISCEEMTKNNQWVIQAISAYKLYCENIKMVESGIDALINVQYITHGFEGEVKEDILNICDSMIACAGSFGTFALSVAGQDSLISLADKEALQKKWVDTIDFLSAKKESSLTGYDNYCYIINGLVDYKFFYTNAAVEGNWEAVLSDVGVYMSYSSEGWKLCDTGYVEVRELSIVNNKAALVLYHQYQSNAKSGESFKDYLTRNKVYPYGEFTQLMTGYTGVENLNLDMGYEMKCYSLYGDYFRDTQVYKINRGNPSKIENKYFVIRDRVVGDTLDTASGKLTVNDTITARALYAEDHWYWGCDEMHFFTDAESVRCYEDRTKKESSDGAYRTFVSRYYTFNDSVDVLWVSALPKTGSDQYSPLGAFESCSALSGTVLNLEFPGEEAKGN